MKVVNKFLKDSDPEIVKVYILVNKDNGINQDNRKRNN